MEAFPEAPPTTSEPGRVLSIDSTGIFVQCGTGLLCLTELQRAGGKRLPAADFLRGFTLAVGDQLGELAA